MLAGAPAFAQSAEDAAMKAALDQLVTDPDKALAQIEAKAAAGDVEYMNLLGVVLRDPPDGVTADPVRAEALQQEAARGGSDSARLNLGSERVMNGTPSDDAEGVAFLQAIRSPQVVEAAAYPLGRAYLFGRGVEQDLERGSTLMLQAARRDPENADANFLAARALLNGWGVPVDQAGARTYFRTSADAGDMRAQWNLGMMLLAGDGGPADAREAFRYVRESAEQGYVEGQISLAVMLALGQGVQTDPAQARRWYQRAVDAGSFHALRGLGTMLLIGDGGPADVNRGTAYLQMAADGGDENAPGLLQRFASKVALADPSSVARIRADWVARHQK